MRVTRSPLLPAILGLFAAAQLSYAITVTPSSVSATLATGTTATRTLTIGNDGTAPLNFVITAADSTPARAGFGTASRAQAASVADGPFVGREAGGEVGTNSGIKGGPAPESSGGPDDFGYLWKDSDDAGGPVFQWIDLTETGNIALSTGDDVSAGPFSIGFSFYYYGTAYTSFYVCSNGFLDFAGSANAYNNTALPSSGAPAAMVAPLWDDLNLLNQAQVYYALVDGKLVVEWYAVPPYSGTGAFTFEAILSPSGEVRFQYLTMGSPTNSCTVGMQDATGARGLTCAYNTSYLHSGLAVRLAAAPDWLDITPNGATIPPGQSLNLSVAFDAGTRCAPSYLAALHVLSDDALSPQVNVPVTMNLTPQPVARVSPATCDFSTIYLGHSSSLPLTMTNAGCADLQVTALTVSNGIFTTDATPPFTLAAGGSRIISVTATPTAIGAASGTLTISSSDPVHPTVTVTLLCQCVSSPSIAVSPASIEAGVPQGSTGTRTLTIANNGGGTLDWTIPIPGIQSKRPAPQAKSLLSPDGASRVVLDSSGGPDSSGYRWADSDEPGGPVYNWIDISATGTVAITGGDDINNGPFPIGFTFKYYDQQFTDFRVCSNGWISFTSNATAYSNSALPNTGAPLYMLAAFWDDLNITGTGKVFYQNVGSDLVVEWFQVPPYSGSGAHTFEIIISPGGSMLFQYKTLGTPVNSCTVGIQNGTGTDGLQCAYNAAYLHESMAILFSTLPQWLTLASSSGHLAPHSSTEVTVNFDATGLDLGPHSGTILVLSNDPQTPEVLVPVTMQVEDPSGAPAPTLPQTDALFPCRPDPASSETLIRFRLRSSAEAEIQVYDLQGRLVRSLLSTRLPGGEHSVLWDGRTSQGTEAASGVYFTRLRVADRSFVRRLSLVR